MKNLLTSIFCFLLATCMLHAENVVFLSDSGSADNDGLTPETAVSTLTAAFKQLGSDGGTIVICGTFTQSANYPSNVASITTYTNTVKLTQVYNGVDYRESGAVWKLTKGVRFFLGGPTTFENITFNQTATTTTPFFLLVSDYYPVVIGDGCSMTGTFTFKDIATGFAVLGGCQDNETPKNPATYSPNITINSGELLVVSFSRSSSVKSTTFPNNDNMASEVANVTINGGKIHNMFLGSVNCADLLGGGTNLTVNGGEFAEKVYVGTYAKHRVDGPVTVKIKGGDFSQYGLFAAPNKAEGQKVTIDITEAGDAELMDLVNLDLDVIDQLNSNYRIPLYEFEQKDAFISSDGVVLPYRIYAPADYASTKSPVVLFLHGLGARGNDNTAQLNSEGAACLYPIFNYKENAVIIAPQLPADEQWVADDEYPGSAAFSTDKKMNGYLTAAKELLDKVASQYNGDTSRLYLLGSSNGAAGVWSLLARYPQTFAAAIPVAGTGDATNASTIAEALSSTPIWTFHGDADETLSVEGTRGLVNAIKQVSDKNIIYTEVAGADHNTIWSRAAVTTGLAEWLYAQPNTTTGVAQSLGESEVRVAVVNRGIYVFTSEAANVLVYDLTGRLVASSATDAGTAAIEGLAPASYVVRVIGRSSQTARKVIL